MDAPRDTARDPAGRALTVLKGVGPARAAALAAIGLRSVHDLLLVVPLREAAAERVPDVRTAREVAAQRPGTRVRVSGRVRNARLFRRGRRSTLRVGLEDETGHIDLLYFNQPYLRSRFEVGSSIECEGPATMARAPVLTAPKVVHEAAEESDVATRYPGAEGLGAEALRKLCRDAARRFADELEEPLPTDELEQHGLPRLADAVRGVHDPASAADFEAARRRLALEPLLALQARAAQRRLASATGRARVVEVSGDEAQDIAAGFPGTFTGAQQRVVEELRGDLARRAPMRRLLQGDVGSGKTWVAAWAAIAVARRGGQAALMAPTELLAEQHALVLEPLFRAAGVRAVLLTGSLPVAVRRERTAALASGEAAVAIGTHALFSADVAFAGLTLAVVDEQHRFGVAQREALFDKGRDVHVLLMTATPIPRTLALSLYGDLETSLLDERPPGRGSVTTRRVTEGKRDAMRGFLVERMDAGERVYWVAPRIDGTGGAEEAFREWCEARGDVELVHGRLPADQRAARLERFRRGEARLVCATTVVEVGVDVPEATVMVVDGAHRLGLAQLHQLRGRVGRGERDSWCFLLGDASAAERFRALEASDDGFELAELDLSWRGMGSLGGLRQAGWNDEGLASVLADTRLVRLAQRLVQDAALRDAYAARPLQRGRERSSP